MVGFSRSDGRSRDAPTPKLGEWNKHGAVYVDTFAAGLGDPNDVHPRDKIPFAELAARAAACCDSSPNVKR